MVIDKKEQAPFPRLCHVIKWPDFEGFGFSLHSIRNEHTYENRHIVVKLERDSPAEMAGLREGDRVLEVNLTNVNNENHRQVRARIGAIANETKLLVVDELADKWYEEKGIVVTNRHNNVIHCKTPIPRPKPTYSSGSVNGFRVYRFRSNIV